MYVFSSASQAIALAASSTVPVRRSALKPL
jgi:hypothetical protein